MAEIDQSQLEDFERVIAELGVDEDVIKASAVVVTRTVSDSVKETTIVRGSKPPPGTYGVVTVEPLIKRTRTRSIKLGNLIHADMGTLLELVAGGVLVGADMVAQPHPIIIAAGLLLIIRSFTRAMKVEFSEREASVFWGLIQACDEKKIATFDSVVERTNAVRKEVGLRPLSEEQIKVALGALESIKSIRPVKDKPGTWRIRERWRRTEHISSKPDRPMWARWFRM
jgi:hypothetical protein